jgi:26S proteasome regulatory subunit N9
MLDAKSQALVDFLLAQGAAFPDQAGDYTQMSELYSRKLWHQLTVLLEAFVTAPGTGAQLVLLYETFVKDFKHRLNKLALARLQVAVAKQIADVGEATEFCKAAAQSAGGDDRQASSLLLCEQALLHLGAEQVNECKKVLEEASTYMEGTIGIETRVQAAYYRAWAAYYKLKGPAHEFYRHALLLLAYLPLKEMASEEALTISFDLGIAALVGEGLYNFGELLEHPVVTTLEATDFAWLAHLLRAFSVGDIDQYESLVETHHAQLAEQPALLANTSFLKEKITLMCLTETLFQHLGPAADRAVPFAAIATASKLPVEQVELLLMRALSLKLIRGKIDQVDGTIAVEWVQPRVLQQPQIAKMTERLATWTGTVDSTLKFLEGETPEFSA